MGNLSSFRLHERNNSRPQIIPIIPFLLLNDIVPKGSNHYLAVNNSFFAEGIS
jgi:hypothetical protein